MTARVSQFFEVYPEVAGAAVPLGVCVDGLVYAGGVAGVDLVTGAPADGLEAQTRLALDHLRAVVEGAGGSTGNIGRAVATVTRVEDREAVYGPWDAMFPDPSDRPAFKVLIGALPPGHLVHIDGLAILGGRRTRTDIEGVPARDPTVRIGDWLFTSRVHGIVPDAGVPEDPAAEAARTFENLAALLAMNGFAPSDLAQMTLFGNDTRHFDLAQRAYETVFPDAAARPALERLVSYVVPRFKVSAELVAVKDRAAPQDAFREIYLCPGSRPVPSGARLGAIAVAPGLAGDDPCTASVAPGGPAAQLRAALASMETFLERAGATSGQLARATFYLPNVDDRSTLNQAWAERFADEAARPPHKYAPAALPEGHEVRLQIVAVPDAARRTLEIPGLKHGDPMAMGALTGNLVTSSRLFGTHAFTGARAKDAAESAALAFAHAGTLLAEAAGGWADIAQVTAFIGDPAYRSLVEAEWRKVAGASAGTPRLNIVETLWAGAGAPRIEIVALL